MAKKSKVATPNWILEGFDSEEDYEKSKGPVKKVKKAEKTFKVRRCPECGCDDVAVVVGQEAKGLWECKNCGWKGKDVKIEELSEDEFMKYLDDKGEEVA
jgi:transcription elongation factor Elf1